MALNRKRDKLDGIDAEQITNLVDCRGWQLVRQRIERTRDIKLRELLKPADAVDTASLRGYIAGLELALGVPKIMLGEIKENRDGSDSKV